MQAQEEPTRQVGRTERRVCRVWDPASITPSWRKPPGGGPVRGGPPDKGGQAVGAGEELPAEKVSSDLGLDDAWGLGDWLQEHPGLTLSLERND